MAKRPGSNPVRRWLESLGTALRRGSPSVRLTLLCWGSPALARRQWLRALTAILSQLLLAGGVLLCLPSVMKLGTLGTVQAQRIYDPVTRRNVWNNYDHSFLILVFGVIGLLLAAAYVISTLQRVIRAHRHEGHMLPTLRQEVHALLGPRFHRTLLTLPVLGSLLVSVIPLLIMACIAFTNYDRNHLVPTNLFTWVGIDNFRSLVSLSAGGGFAHAFRTVFVWTLVWAALATFSCYFGGILLAMLIAHRDIRCKRFFRTCFTAAMAVPQFVSLLAVRSFFADVGVVNTFLKSIGVTDWLHTIGAIPTSGYIPFLTHPSWARPMLLLINLWVGVPYQMLIATGVLMNIPPELTEAARIDGAGPWQVFRHITMPYILFITGPSLVSALVANVNNFSVIWLLSRDVYTTTDQMLASAGATEIDLLVTWLYRLTQDQSNYRMAAVIGMLVFAVCSLLTLTAFRRLNRNNREESFQ